MPIIKKHQTTVDFTTQYAGSVSGLFEMAMLNGIGITDDVAAGTDLMVRVTDERTVKFWKNQKLDVVGGPLNLNLIPGGIGYMQIGNTFKVS